MAIFSTLTHLLKRTYSFMHQTQSTEQPLNILLKENKALAKVSLITESTHVNINTTGYSNNFLNLFRTGNVSKEAYLNRSFNASLLEEWTNFINTLTSRPKTDFLAEDELSSDSNIQFSNETFPDAEYLRQSWWNIFDERYMRHDWAFTILLILAYISILVAGVIGNVMVILVVLLRPQMRTVTNMFITNLAVTDLIVIVFCVPSTLLANILTPWILGLFMCKAVAYVQGVSVCASAYSLAAISLDRCQAIYRNYERPRGFSRTICIKTIFVIWMNALLLTIPWAVTFDLKVSEYDGLRYCEETWENERQGNLYFLVVNLVGFYAIPLLLIFVSNWIIYYHVAHRHVPQESASSAPLRKMHRETRHVVLRMLGIFTLTFLLSWLPLYILVITIKLSENISESEYNILGILMPVAQWLGSWNSSINPILYAFLNKKFRRMFKSILPAWIPVKTAGQYDGSVRTPSFTNTAYTRKSFARSKTYSRGDFHRNHQNGPSNSHNHASILVSRFHERTGTVSKTIEHIITTIIPATAVLISDNNPKIVFDTAIVEQNPTSSDIVTDV